MDPGLELNGSVVGVAGPEDGVCGFVDIGAGDEEVDKAGGVIEMLGWGELEGMVL